MAGHSDRLVAAQAARPPFLTAIRDRLCEALDVGDSRSLTVQRQDPHSVWVGTGAVLAHRSEVRRTDSCARSVARQSGSPGQLYDNMALEEALAQQPAMGDLAPAVTVMPVHTCTGRSGSTVVLIGFTDDVTVASTIVSVVARASTRPRRRQESRSAPVLNIDGMGGDLWREMARPVPCPVTTSSGNKVLQWGA